MSTTRWLRQQVKRLEEEIRRSSIFEDDHPATPQQLEALRRKVIVHTYMKQQLLRRDPEVVVEEYDTRELVEIRRER